MLYGWKDNLMLTNCLAACAHLTITVSEIERDIGRKSSFFYTPIAFDAPVRGVTVGISASPLGWNGVATRWWKNFEDIFIRFDVIHERDRRTDGQTDRQTLRDSIDRACIASRGNDQLEINMHHLPKAMQYRQALWAILTKFCVLWDSYRSALLSKISTLWV